MKRSGLLGPAHGGKRPQSGRKPGVEHVGLLPEPVRLAVGAEGGVLLAHDDLAAVLAIPGRDAVAPPDLARDAPVADVVHPFIVGLFPLLGDDPGPALLHGIDGLFGQGFGVDEPLLRQVRLDGGLAPVALAHWHRVGGLVDEIALLLEILLQLSPARETVHPQVGARVFVHDPGLVHDHNDIEPVSEPELVVVEVVGRGDLHRAGAELLVHHGVGDDGDPPVEDRKDNLPAHHRGVPLVRGIHGDAGVAQHGLGPGGCHHDFALPFGEGIADVPEKTAFFLVLHLEIGDGAVAPGAPVHDIVAPEDQTLPVEGDEHLSDRIGEPLVHGEADPLPVAGCAQSLELVDDQVAVLFPPLPDLVDEGLSPQVVPGDALCRQGLFHHVLGGDAGMVGSRHPQRVEPVHPLVADHDILQGVVQGMPHVENPGDVRRRDDDGIGRLDLITFIGMEIALVHPEIIPFLFNVLGVVFSVSHGFLLTSRLRVS